MLNGFIIINSVPITTKVWNEAKLKHYVVWTLCPLSPFEFSLIYWTKFITQLVNGSISIRICDVGQSIRDNIVQLLTKSIFSVFKYFDLLHKSQSGFRPKYSVESALTHMVDSWIRAETCLKWFESYLTNRTQRVSLNSLLSEPAHVTWCSAGINFRPIIIFIFY